MNTMFSGSCTTPWMSMSHFRARSSAADIRLYASSSDVRPFNFSSRSVAEYLGQTLAQKTWPVEISRAT